MKYLIQHTKESIITIGVFVSVAIVIAWVITAICKGDFSYEHMIAVVGALFEMFGWYYNMPTSPENSEHTDIMRLEKQKDEIEYGYFEDVDEEGEDLDEDEMNTEDINDGVNDEIPEDGDEDE